MQQQERYEYQPKQRQYQQQVENNQYEFYDQQQQYEPSYNYPEPQGQIVERNYETDNRYYQVQVDCKLHQLIKGFNNFLS